MPLAKLLAVGGGHHHQRAVPLAALPQGFEAAPQTVVGEGDVVPVHGPEDLPLARRQGDGGIEVGLELVGEHPERQVETRGLHPVLELRPPHIGRRRLRDVDPDELTAAHPLQPAGGLAPFFEVSQPIEPLVVAEGPGVGGLPREAGGLVARRLQGLGQGEKRRREVGLPAVERLVLPGAQAGEQRGHGRHALARWRNGVAGPVGAPDQGIQIGHQPRLATQRSHHVDA